MSLDAKVQRIFCMTKRNKKNLTGGQSLCEVYNILTKEFGRFSTEPHKGSVPL
jgi:hypothetical protein